MAKDFTFTRKRWRCPIPEAIAGYLAFMAGHLVSPLRCAKKSAKISLGLRPGHSALWIGPRLSCLRRGRGRLISDSLWWRGHFRHRFATAPRPSAFLLPKY